MPASPLPVLEDGRQPVISSGFGWRGKGKKRHRHKGADITYRTAKGDPPVGQGGRYTRHRTPNFFSPEGLPVFVTESGVVVQAKMKPGIRGDVWVHHPASGRVTRYAHLSSIAVKEGQKVEEGERLGVWGAGEGTPFVHLHFELLTAGKKDSQRDPAQYLASAVPGFVARKKERVANALRRGATKSWLPLLLIGAFVFTRS